LVTGKVADKCLLEQQFTLSLVNLSQIIDARISSTKLMAKSDIYLHKYALCIINNVDNVKVARFLHEPLEILGMSFFE
jgi:hypothetical protein